MTDPTTTGQYEYTIQHGDGTETVYDPMVGVYDQSTSPFSSKLPDVKEVDLQMQVVVNSLSRDNTHQWRITTSGNEMFPLDTTTLKYTEDVPPFAQSVYEFINEQAQAGFIVSAHAAVRLDNFTHPPVAAGVVPLPKGHRDSTYTQAELLEFPEWLESRLLNICSDLKNTARY